METQFHFSLSLTSAGKHKPHSNDTTIITNNNNNKGPTCVIQVNTESVTQLTKYIIMLNFNFYAYMF